MNNSSNFTELSLTTINTTLITSIHLHDKELLGWIISLLFVNAFGIVANILLLIALAIHKPLRCSSSCALIAHCVVIDLYNTAVAVPIATIPSYLGVTYNLPRNFCKYQSLFVYVVFAASMYSSSILALYRLTAAVLPRQFIVISKKPVIVLMIIVPWIVTLTLNAFPAAESGLKSVRSLTTGGCMFAPTMKNDNESILLYTTISTYIPTAVMGISYLIVLVKTTLDIQRKRNSLALQRRLEISRTLFLSFMWHCIAIYPVIISITFFPNEYAASFSTQLGIKFLTNSFSAINPIFFWASSKLFHDAVQEVLECKWLSRMRSRRVKPILITVDSVPSTNRRETIPKPRLYLKSKQDTSSRY